MDRPADRSSAKILPLRSAPGPSRYRDGALATLASGPLAGRFCAWRGASDQRYVASVYAVDQGAPDFGLPEFEAFILISVCRSPAGRRIVGVAAIERISDRRAALALAQTCGIDEWHVHFLAEDRAARATLVSDLLARHGVEGTEARCA